MNQAHQLALAKAQQAVDAAAAQVASCPWRPVYHFAAPANWINDPNGLIHWRGQYHLFYQHYPYAPKWGPMHWGHATSTDLWHWKHLPIALAPSLECEISEGGCGCFSGSATEMDGKLALIYTAHADKRSPKEVQCLATSTDGINFTKHPANPVIPAPPPEGNEDFRDPKVWKHGDHFYVILGTGRDGIGKAALYRSLDLASWEYVGITARSDGTLGTMWECPDLFELDGKDVLIFSPIGLGRPLSMCLIGKLDYATGKFHEESRGLLDHGGDFYAPQTFADATGRRIMIAWTHSWGSATPTEAHGWSGIMSVPRELRLEAGRLVQRPVRELQAVHSAQHHVGSFTVSAGQIQRLELAGDAMEIHLRLRPGEAASAGLRLRCSGDGRQYTEVAFRRADGHVVLDLEQSGEARSGQHAVAATADAAGTIELRILLDRSSIEIFTADGQAISSRIYPAGDSTCIDAFATGGDAEFVELTAWHVR